MDTQKKIKQELNEQAPKLAGIEKGNPFSVPNAYFQSLPDKVVEKVKATETSAQWMDRLEKWLNNIFTLILQPRYAVPMATILILLVVGINLNKTSNNKSLNVSEQLSELPIEEINAYIIEHIEEFDLIAFTDNDDKSSSKELVLPDNLTNEDLSNYLIDNIETQTFEEDFL